MTAMVRSPGDLSVELLVVGAGPVGLLAALLAARQGLDVAVVDQTFRGFGRGYAALLHPSSARTLEELGLGAKLREVGREIRAVTLHVGDAAELTLSLASPAFSLKQSALEDLLLAALRQEEVPIHAPCEASTIQQDARAVRVRVVRKELVTVGSPGDPGEWQPVDSSTITADFVIGADGYGSKVRGALGIDVVSVAGTKAFAMFEVPAADASSATVELGFADGLGSVVVPLPEAQARLGFEITGGLDRDPDAERLRELVSTRAPWFEERLREMHWSSVVHFERRLARHFGAGRVWLAGDAAHVTHPFGAQSMNLGLSEARELALRATECLRGGASVSSLGTYDAERRREWHKLLGVNVRYDLLPHAPAWLPAHAREIGPALPASGEDLDGLLQQLGVSVG
ncbi:MAG TPA: NAD(P)/FAD-dependent oxidoreductase [Polyangiaceae bacterium]|jgi:2-polyprenyl-6-methoxyphenol hydroxylase-like FAD-dependent oxidoreductase|nr:NAD(P)/FAD-dependent oxidoreductase [Polyangiaceae bacterium]